MNWITKSTIIEKLFLNKNKETVCWRMSTKIHMFNHVELNLVRNLKQG